MEITRPLPKNDCVLSDYMFLNSDPRDVYVTWLPVSDNLLMPKALSSSDPLGHRVMELWCGRGYWLRACRVV